MTDNMHVSYFSYPESRKNDYCLFHHRLQHWYREHGRRDLPWRQTGDPYAIYISEIMLQQTQVRTVLERYYFPFLERFPTFTALAAAKQDDVLRAWQGMGYYNRAINLHKAAKQIGIGDSGLGIREVKKSTGLFSLTPNPQSLIPHLMSLPGIGRNTAHAVAAFAYHQPVAVMEANVRRVLARIFALERPAEAELWNKAEALLDTANPFDYNQAMMDLGALVCTKTAPRCKECPALPICKGKTSPESFPAPKAKKPVPVRRKHIVVLQNAQGKYFAAPRKTKLLNGLYHFKEMDKPSGDIHLGSIRQQYSHFTLDAEVWLKNVKITGGKNWHTLAQLKKLPMSMAEKKIIAMIP